MTTRKSITTPLSREDVQNLNIGDEILLSGDVYTARDAAHKRLIETFEKGERLPFEPEGQVIYFVGPTPARPGHIIGSAGPTTAARMNKYSPTMIKLGIRGLIGKGAVGDEVHKAMQKYGTVYFLAIGGTGAYLRHTITAVEVIAYEELGPEAIRKLTLKEFPCIVAQDAHGGNLFVEGRRKYEQD